MERELETILRGRTAHKGAVAAGHPLTASAGAEVLKAGGNAFDAVLAAMCMATVAEPVLASFGGGGFLLAHPADGAARLFDFFAQTPKRGPLPDGRDFYPVIADFGAAQQEFHIGLGAMAVPGAVSGLFHAHRALGRMPLERLIEPALEAARDGYELTAFQGYLFSVVGPIYLAGPEARRIFARPGAPDQLIGAGDRFRNPDTADFLDALVREGPGLFYEGDVARRIVEDCRTGGGTLSADDLASYRTEERTPLAVDFAGARILTNPPPSTGGLLIAFALKLLEGAAGIGGAWGEGGHLSSLARALALTEDARRDAVAGDMASLLGAENLARYRRAMAETPQMPRGTTHISAMDGDGNACALTLSNGEGNGYVVPGTGVMMNNMLGEEDINPAGFDVWPLDVRLGSMMAPTAIVDRQGLTVLGSGGSNRIRSAVTQAILNLLAFGMTPKAAVEAPRIHVERGHLDLEPGWPAEAAEAAANAFPDNRVWPERNLFFGGVHMVSGRNGDMRAAGDPRRAGAAVVLGA
jgi:gamma-glutamyltranspeptidase/glutathione hydrolase